MENGLQEFIIENFEVVETLIFAVLCCLISIIGFGFVGIVRLSYKIYNSQNENNEKRFEEGDEEFKKLKAGQKELKEEIKKGREEAQVQREQIKDAVSKIAKGLLKLLKDHKNNHKDD